MPTTVRAISIRILLLFSSAARTPARPTNTTKAIKKMPPTRDEVSVAQAGIVLGTQKRPTKPIVTVVITMVHITMLIRLEVMPREFAAKAALSRVGTRYGLAAGAAGELVNAVRSKARGSSAVELVVDASSEKRKASSRSVSGESGFALFTRPSHSLA